MCGIIGYTGKNNAIRIITDGLKNLEYRGYDSAGLAVFTPDGLRTVKTTGRVSTLDEKTSELKSKDIFCGIGHTRWATHGAPTERNCHPHTAGKVCVVHNGIIENYKELKNKMTDRIFLSDTDTEVIAHIINNEYSRTKNPVTSIIRAVRHLKGSYALGIIFDDIENTVFAVRNDSPLLIGLGKNEKFIASDTVAFSHHTGRFLRPDDGDIVKITAETTDIYDINGNRKKLKEETVQHTETVSEKNEFSHHMLREIHEEPEKMKATFESMTEDGLPCFSGSVRNMLNSAITGIRIVACGTALHSGLLGRYFIEELSGIPVRTESAGEFRYAAQTVSATDIVIIISQSGETADSLAALRLVKSMGIRTLAIVNAQGSSIANEAENVICTLAGREIAVASTKAFNVQCQTLLLLAAELGIKKGKISKDRAREILTSHRYCFDKAIPSVLADKYQFSAVAQYLKNCSNAFFIGRGIDSTLGSEGSLKLKEISYIHSEAFPASELKHGTISLIEDGTPVIATATDEKLYDKMRNNILEVKARGAKVICICPETAKSIIDTADFVITLPDTETFSLPFTAACALQLTAYYTALAMGRDIDKPRNLAKSVTVE